jgi:hypothetical protein
MPWRSRRRRWVIFWMTRFCPLLSTIGLGARADLLSASPFCGFGRSSKLRLYVEECYIYVDVMISLAAFAALHCLWTLRVCVDDLLCPSCRYNGVVYIAALVCYFYFRTDSWCLRLLRYRCFFTVFVVFNIGGHMSCNNTALVP